MWKVNYDYGTTDNNGNVKSQQITVPSQFTAVQNYSYDSLNRLKSANETISGSQTWKQTFTFDRYGNRRFDTSNNNTTTLPSGYDPNVFNPTFNTANNRMNDNQGYEYDSAGNVTKDASNKRFIYDAENKQTSFGTNGSNTNGGTYSYDGDGKRIKKIVGTETTIFVYNASGQLVAEYTATAPTNPTISYLTSDTLGTPRINTDAKGQVTARHDYMPFGEEIFNFGGRNSQAGIDAKYQQNDNIRQKFTLKERDNETGLDYFGARYYGSNHGRFTSPDPLFASGRPASPQTWNRYAYVLNNPLRLVDSTGLVDDDPQDDKKKQDKAQKPKIIYIFVTFTTKEQERTIDPDGSAPAFTAVAAPDFESLEKNNPNVRVLTGDTEATRDAFEKALQDPNAAAVIFVGHSAVAEGREVEQKPFMAGGVNFGSGTSLQTFDPEGGIQVQAKNVAVFSCDSQRIEGLFKTNGAGQAVIGMNSGRDGLTSTNALSQAGFAAANNFIQGKGPDAAVVVANKAVVSASAAKTFTAPGGMKVDASRNSMNTGDKVRRIR